MVQKVPLRDWPGRPSSHAEARVQHMCIGDVQKMYQNIMVENVLTSVLVEVGEDETVIIKMLEYLQQSDMVVGSCGGKGHDHKCDAMQDMY